MIQSADLATLRVRRIIFHDVPNNPKGSANHPTLADSETDIDAARAQMLKNRLVRVLGAKAAYPIVFPYPSTSVVPDHVAKYTGGSRSSSQFIAMSQIIAKHLFDLQDGSMSPGLLCVIEVTCGASPGVAVLKLEREQGAELQWQEKSGKKVVQMSVLDNLVLTDGTRLFKSALFVRRSKSSFSAVACDSQYSIHSSVELAQFWLRFLGCKVTEEPRVATQKWFDATVQFINEMVVDPVEKTAIYEHVVSELNSNKSTFSAKKFAEDYVSIKDSKSYLDYLKEREIPLHQLVKDTSDIAAKLRRTSYHTAKGVTVTAPAELSELVDVSADEIVVHDQLSRVVSK